MFAQLVPTTEMVPADDTVVGSCAQPGFMIPLVIYACIIYDD
jgi:hypothetical protein